MIHTDADPLLHHVPQPDTSESESRHNEKMLGAKYDLITQLLVLAEQHQLTPDELDFVVGDALHAVQLNENNETVN